MSIRSTTRGIRGLEEPRIAKRIVVIGGGISGLAAAHELTRAGLSRTPAARSIAPQITLLESSPRLGGKIHTTPFAGSLVDTGADAMLVRLPWAAHLCRELGIAEELVSPSGAASFVYSRGGFHRFANKAVMGVPARAVDIIGNGALSPFGRLRALADLVLPRRVGRSGADPTVGEFFRKRFGNEFTNRVVDALVGGIHAGDIDRLGLDSCLGQIADLSTRHASVMRSVDEHLRRRSPEDSTRPVFQTHPDGMSALIDALTNRLEDEGADIVLQREVTHLEVDEQGLWTVTTDDGVIEADAVVLATPAFVSARLLSRLSPDAAALLRSIEYSSVGIVRLAYARETVGHRLDGNGYVTPSIEGDLVTACTWSSSKWQHLQREGHVIVRASVGRTTDTRFVDLTDPEVIDAVHRELSKSLDISSRPIGADVTRWMNALPQYEPGHETRNLRIEKATGALPGIVLCGAAQQGIGITACVRRAQDAAVELLSSLGNDRIRSLR